MKLLIIDEILGLAKSFNGRYLELYYGSLQLKKGFNEQIYQHATPIYSRHN